MVVEPLGLPCMTLGLTSSKDKEVGRRCSCMSLLGHPKATILSSFGGSYGELDKTRSFPVRSSSKVPYPLEGQPNGLFSKPSKGGYG